MVSPFDDVNVYPVIGVPPSDAGATHVTVAEPSPGVAVMPDGAPGGVAADPRATTFRMRLLVKSLMKKLPATSRLTRDGVHSWAAVAGPPSPEYPPVPVPATVEMTPAVSMRR